MEFNKFCRSWHFPLHSPISSIKDYFAYFNDSISVLSYIHDTHYLWTIYFYFGLYIFYWLVIVSLSVNDFTYSLISFFISLIITVFVGNEFEFFLSLLSSSRLCINEGIILLNPFYFYASSYLSVISSNLNSMSFIFSFKNLFCWLIFEHKRNLSWYMEKTC